MADPQSSPAGLSSLFHHSEVYDEPPVGEREFIEKNPARPPKTYTTSRWPTESPGASYVISILAA
jgi:hypothetical protein